MRRTLTSLSAEELQLLEQISNDCRIVGWKLVAYLLDDAAYVFEAGERRRLKEYLEAAYARTLGLESAYESLRARRIFDDLMNEPGLRMGQTKPRTKP